MARPSLLPAGASRELLVVAPLYVVLSLANLRTSGRYHLWLFPLLLILVLRPRASAPEAGG